MSLYDQRRRRPPAPTMPGEVTVTEPADPADADAILAAALEHRRGT